MKCVLRRCGLVLAAALAPAAGACGTPPSAPSSSPPPPSSSAASAVSLPPPAPFAARPSVSATDGTPPLPKRPTSEELFARLRSDFVGCYEAGKKEVPTMTSGRVTLHAAIDQSGRTTCAVPSDDTGLTQDVEDCMRRRFARETYPSQPSAWSTALPIVVENGSLALGAPAAKPLIETIESHGLAEDIYDVIDRILPDLKACISGIPRSNELRVVYVGAEVGKDGKVACALASSSASVPDGVRECAASTFSKATFKPPKRGYGLISIPLRIVEKK